ncbi:MAG: PLP-dependent aminotransferase family protein [Clostridiales Family XIII bacterium]|jgi:GntR family transcriptional regulator/MocR family aminotransferase|nr:PLP-dependent aminotransferase family protein [Clostridiales Family XIII bacterium]
MIVLDARGKTPLHVQIFNRIRYDILAGKTAPGVKLPSARALSVELSVSRNTVDLAYSRLSDEGFICGVPRVGYFVETGTAFRGGIPDEGGSSRASIDDVEDEGIRFDFRGEKVSSDDLSRTYWQRFVTKSLWEDGTEGMSRVEHFDDDYGLREEIRKYVYRFRGIECDSDMIFPAADARACAELVCLSLKLSGAGARVGTENPCRDRVRRVFRKNGFEVLPIELDKYGATIESAVDSGAGTIWLTPSCQFPTAAVMPIERRENFAEWARRDGRIIVEDDSGCHYYYGRRPLPAIHSLIPENVRYIGGLSDVLFPGGAVSWLILPKKAAAELRGRLADNGPLAPFLIRHPLELYMREGRLESRLRKMRKRQGAKRRALISALGEVFEDRIFVSDTRSGLHVLVRAGWDADESELVEQARRTGVAVCSTSQFWYNTADGVAGGGDSKRGATVLLHCGGVREEDIPGAVLLLREVWKV